MCFLVTWFLLVEVLQHVGILGGLRPFLMSYDYCPALRFRHALDFSFLGVRLICFPETDLYANYY